MLRQASLLGPDLVEPYAMLGYAHLWDPGPPDAGIVALDLVLRVQPGRSDAFHNAVLLELRRENLEGALERVRIPRGDPETMASARRDIVREGVRQGRNACRAGDLPTARSLRDRLLAATREWPLDPALESAIGSLDTMISIREEFGGATATGPPPSPPPTAEEDQPFPEEAVVEARFYVALELARAKRYEDALPILEEIAGAPVSRELGESVRDLHDLVRYNVALAAYRAGDLDEAIRMARQLAASARKQEVRRRCEQLLARCRQDRETVR